MWGNARVTMTTRSERQPADLLSIQYLRAVAAIAVVFFHAAKMVKHSFEAGAAGVDIFFVISGFIMWTIAQRKEPTPGAFLKKRAARIVPLYWILTLFVAALGLLPVVLQGSHPPDSITHIVASLFFVPQNNPPVIVAGWTLNFEVLFYLLFALSLLLAARARLVALTLVMGSLVLLGWRVHFSDPILATITNPLLLEFLAGIWIGKAWMSGLRLPSGVGLVAVVLGFVAIVEVPRFGIYPEPIRALVWGLPALAIVAGAVSLEPVRNIRALKFLGDASYSIYLVHVTALAQTGVVLAPLHLPLAVAFWICVLAAIAAGGLCHVLLERPLLRMVHSAAGGQGTARRIRQQVGLGQAAENADPA